MIEGHINQLCSRDNTVNKNIIMMPELFSLIDGVCLEVLDP